VIARGFASTRVGDVAAALGVSTGLVFYHFTNKETLLGEAFRYAAGEDLDRLSATAAGDGSAAQRLDRILRLYSPAGSSEAWLLWIDAWGQALRSPELAEVSRQLDLRWKQTLAAVIREGVAAGEFTCSDPDPAGRLGPGGRRGRAGRRPGRPGRLTRGRGYQEAAPSSRIGGSPSPVCRVLPSRRSTTA
jgi:AcrR family transcriptional regulator